MFYKDQNGKPLPKENFKPSSILKSNIPETQTKSVEKYDGNKTPVWVYVVIILAVLLIISGCFWYFWNKREVKQQFGFNFY